MIRKAIKHCAKQQGLAFVTDHANSLRPELICYAVLSGNWPRPELQKLRNRLSS